MGSVAVLLYKNFGHASISFLDFFINGAYILAVLYSGLVITSFLYFRKRYQVEVARLDAQPDQLISPSLPG
jgi:hypothetical protein